MLFLIGNSKTPVASVSEDIDDAWGGGRREVSAWF